MLSARTSEGINVISGSGLHMVFRGNRTWYSDTIRLVTYNSTDSKAPMGEGGPKQFGGTDIPLPNPR